MPVQVSEKVYHLSKKIKAVKRQGSARQAPEIALLHL